MEGLKPPKPLSLAGNVSENWRRWIQQFRLYLNATGRDKKPEQVQCSTLLAAAGEEALDVFNTFEIPEDDQNKLEPLIKQFELYCNPRKNVTFERHVFFTRNQGVDEGIDVYVTELKKLAKTCEFEGLNDSLIKDRIVCGIHNAELKARLLREEDLTLQKAIHMCRAAERSKTQLNDLEAGPQQIGAVYSSKKPVRQGKQRRDRQDERFQPEPAPNTECDKCGYNHKIGRCFAYGKVCRKCKKIGHFAKMCTGN